MKTPAKIALTLSLLIPLVIGCAHPQAADKTTYSSNTASQSEFSQAQLDAMLAPIALYPDAVLSHVLIAATYPLEVVEADRWVRTHKGLKGDDAVEAVDDQDWDPSVKALVAFPDILQRMSDDLDWTQRLGDAFLADQERVMDSIQILRNRAYDSGNLDKVEHVRVVREEKIIVIEPSVERVVYVPVYDTRVVYGNWWWPDYPPTYWHHPSSYVFVSGFYWGPRVYLGPRFYFSGCHWRDRRVVVVDHHYHSRPRFYDSRSIVRHQSARHWNHNPVHRRGVAYYDDRVRTRYNSPRESYRDARVYRDSVRNPHITTNQARDSRQFSNKDAGGMRNTLRDNQRAQPATRADDLRARMNARQGNSPTERAINRADRASVPERATQNTPARSATDRTDRTVNRTTDRTVQRSPSQEATNRALGNTTRTGESRNTTTRPPQAERQQEHRMYGIDRMNRSEGTSPTRTERVERTAPQRIERVERSERIERTAPRIERSDTNFRSRDESRSTGRESSGTRTIDRGGRER